MALKGALKAVAEGETLEEIKEDLDLWLKRNPRYCVCCGKRA